MHTKNAQNVMDFAKRTQNFYKVLQKTINNNHIYIYIYNIDTNNTYILLVVCYEMKLSFLCYCNNDIFLICDITFFLCLIHVRGVII